MGQGVASTPGTFQTPGQGRLGSFTSMTEQLRAEGWHIMARSVVGFMQLVVKDYDGEASADRRRAKR